MSKLSLSATLVAIAFSFCAFGCQGPVGPTTTPSASAAGAGSSGPPHVTAAAEALVPAPAAAPSHTSSSIVVAAPPTAEPAAPVVAASMTTAAAPTTAPAGDVPTITLTVPITTNEFYVFVGVIEFVLLVCAFNLMRGPSAELVA